MSSKKRCAPLTPGKGVSMAAIRSPSPNASLLSQFDIYEDLMSKEDVYHSHEYEQLQAQIVSLTQQLAAEHKLRKEMETDHVKLQQKHDKAVKELHTCLVASRRAEALKVDELVRVQAEAKPPPCCPNCMAVMDKPEGVPKPRLFKPISAKNCVEIYFSNYNRMQRWCRGYGLITNTDGLPILPQDLTKQEQVRQAKCLEDVDSLLSKKSPIPAPPPPPPPLPPPVPQPKTKSKPVSTTGKANKLNKRGRKSTSACNAVPLGQSRVFPIPPNIDHIIAASFIPPNQLSRSSAGHVIEPNEANTVTPRGPGGSIESSSAGSSFDFAIPKFKDSFKIPKKASRGAVSSTPKKHSPLEVLNELRSEHTNSNNPRNAQANFELAKNAHQITEHRGNEDSNNAHPMTEHPRSLHPSNDHKRMDLSRDDNPPRVESRVTNEKARSIVRNARRPTPSPAIMKEERQRLIKEYSVEPSLHRRDSGKVQKVDKRKVDLSKEDSSRKRRNSRHRSTSPPRKIRRDDAHKERCSRREDISTTRRHRDIRSSDDRRHTSKGERRRSSFERKKFDDERRISSTKKLGDKHKLRGRKRGRSGDKRHAERDENRRSRGRAHDKHNRHSPPRKSHSRNRTSSQKSTTSPQKCTTSPQKSTTSPQKSTRTIDNHVIRNLDKRSKSRDDASESIVHTFDESNVNEMIAVQSEQVELSPQVPADFSLPHSNNGLKFNEDIANVDDEIEEGELTDDDDTYMKPPTPKYIERGVEGCEQVGESPQRASSSPNTSHVSQVSLHLSPNESRPNSNESGHFHNQFINIPAPDKTVIHYNKSSRSSSQQHVIKDEDLLRGVSIQLQSPGSEDDEDEAGIDVRVWTEGDIVRSEKTDHATISSPAKHHCSPFKMVLTSELTQSSSDEVVKGILRERKESPSSNTHLMDNKASDSVLREMMAVAPCLSPIKPRPRVPPLEAAIDDIESWSVIDDVPLPHHREHVAVPPIRLKRMSDCSHTSTSSFDGRFTSPTATEPTIHHLVDVRKCVQVPSKLSPIKSVFPQAKPISRPIGSKLKAMQALMQSDAPKKSSKKKQKAILQQPPLSSTPISKLDKLKQLWNKK